MNRKGLIAVIAIFGIFIISVIALAGFIWFRSRNNPLQAQQRTLIAEMTYCNSENLTPCIVSFSASADGNMLVNLLTPPTYPTFYLTIGETGAENKYECQAVADFPTNAYCTGTPMHPGETLQFTIRSVKDNTPLAEGRFTLLGVLLATPVSETTATQPPPTAETELPTETSEPFIILGDTPTPTESTSSYPNPTSYPNPSKP